MFQRSGACCMWLWYLRGVVHVVCDRDVSEEWCVLHVTGIFKLKHAPLLLNIPLTYNTHHSSYISQTQITRTTPLKHPRHKQHAPFLLNIQVTCNTHHSSCCMWLGYLRGVVRVLSDWDVSEEWCVLYVTGMFKRSGACCLCLGCLRGVVRVVCNWDI
jgi:hypothetical protein